MLRQLRKNEKGIVFVTVLMIIIVMMVLTISIVSINVNQIMLTEGEVKRIQAEILAMGALAYTFANQLSSSPGNTISYTETLDNVTFNVVAQIGAPGSGIMNTATLNIDVTIP